jgi:hypothetical protein
LPPFSYAYNFKALLLYGRHFVVVVAAAADIATTTTTTITTTGITLKARGKQLFRMALGCNKRFALQIPKYNFKIVPAQDDVAIKT